MRRRTVFAVLAAALLLSGCLESAQPLVSESNAITPMATGFYERCEISATGVASACEQVHVFIDDQKRYRTVTTDNESVLFMIADGATAERPIVQVSQGLARTIYGYAEPNDDGWIAVIPMCKSMLAQVRSSLELAGQMYPDTPERKGCYFRSLGSLRSYLNAIAVRPGNGAPLDGAERRRFRRQEDSTAFIAQVRKDFDEAIARGYWKKAVAMADLQARYVYDKDLRAEILEKLKQARPRLDAWVAAQTELKEREAALLVQGWADLFVPRVPDLRWAAGTKDPEVLLSATVLSVTAAAMSGRDSVEICRMADQADVILPMLQWPMDDWMSRARKIARCD